MGQERGMDRARRREEQEAEEAQAQESEIKAVSRGCCGAGVRHRGGRLERPAGARRRRGRRRAARRRRPACRRPRPGRRRPAPGPRPRPGPRRRRPTCGPWWRRATPPSARAARRGSRPSTRAPSATAAPRHKRRGTSAATARPRTTSRTSARRAFLDDDVSELTEGAGVRRASDAPTASRRRAAACIFAGLDKPVYFPFFSDSPPKTPAAARLAIGALQSAETFAPGPAPGGRQPEF